MRGKDKVITHLNDALRAELLAINQYFLHAEMCENWGYHRLADQTKKDAIDEMKHAEALIERILFLDSAPKLGMGLPIKAGKNVPEQLESDLALEIEAVASYNAAMKVCVEEGDNASRELFRKLLLDEERHVDYLETQLHIIKEVGIENYLARQMHEEK
jgi:bacterioferritin